MDNLSEEENSQLRELTRLRRSSPSSHSEWSEGSGHSVGHEGGPPVVNSLIRRGKAPPVETFTGVDPECRFEDWLPTLKRAASWNRWSEDVLLQLADHLKGRTLQEWNLLPDNQKSTYDQAVKTLKGILDPGT